MLVLSGHDKDVLYIEHAGETLRVVLISTAKGKLGFDGPQSFLVQREKVRLAKQKQADRATGEAA